MWGVASLLLLAALVACAVEVGRGETMERLIALELAGTVAVIELMLLAQLFERDFYFDVALTLALASFAGTLAFVRFLGHWL